MSSNAETTKLLILGGILLLFGGVIGLAIFVDARIEDGVHLGDIKELLLSQEIMPDMELPVLGTMPPLDGTGLLNRQKPFEAGAFDGKVVLVDFWTYSCVNCVRTLPYLTRWDEQYRNDGLIIIGVHTPEFAFEKEPENVIEAMQMHNIQYPVLLDNEYNTWRNFNNRFWPAKYIFDQNGNLRYSHFGEGAYDETEQVIQRLLGKYTDLVELDEKDHEHIHSPETYFGLRRAARIASNGENVQKGFYTDFVYPDDDLALNWWSLNGRWRITDEYANGQAGAKWKFHFDAKMVNVVLGSKNNTPGRVNIYVDGEPAQPDQLGADAQYDEERGIGYTIVDFPDLYQLLDLEPGPHIIELEFEGEETQIYAITFG